MAGPRLVILDPSGRASDLIALATRIGVAPAVIDSVDDLDRFGSAPILVSASAAALLIETPNASQRWVFGDGDASAKVAGAAVGCGAIGVLIRTNARSCLNLSMCRGLPQRRGHPCARGTAVSA